MSQRTGTEEGVGAHFGLPYAPCLPARPVRDAGFSVTRLEWRLNGEANRLVSLPPDSAYFLMLYLKDAYHCDVAPDGTESETLRFRQGSVCLVDLAHGACIRLFSDLDSLAFQLPRELIREVSEFSAAPRATTLRCRRGEDDDVLRNLGAALLPLFERQGNSHTAVLQHIAIAICAHLLHAYGDHGGQGGPRLTQFTVWQERAAKNFMIDHFADQFPMAAAASAAGVSIRRFIESFKRVTGQTPKQWLLGYRTARAKQYLGERSLTLAEIATGCGFTDEDHFTKVFRRVAGTTPAAWRARWLH
ncbi:AraC family transcriptional regulator [Sinorhizobium meliloti]|uniref:Transcriptional regulator n=1 Tax=Sinorhizobium meliloti (strain SM11) TaxID=707241 RepID=F7XDS8_SINMM|nr:AraC family transcriptional regulator [Sinorhizobium meliloti]AEH81703.1 Transcriptional regulator [Sinorhizobium meliloti SM11]ARS66368.1 AraC family transcriptional regulator [Sinorhizobium meliloti RU11/001]MBP2469510.1 AraC-like DNA-binding protein [Sinorhizobium meliloti]MDE3763690.1 helix-turn-helix transcriptional regulator [Sinorhizobium meliloti]MDE3776048.1 helix-turn-helix transcriptional regulator [Sinorhizobium meliloti]